MDALLNAVSWDVARVKFGACKALRNLSECAPDLIYPQFDFFASFLRHENSILRWNAILLLGNLAPVDGERRVDRIIDDYLSPIRGPHLIDAANTIRGATAMATAKPYLADLIARHIVEVERASYATPECRNVAIGHAIDSPIAFSRSLPTSGPFSSLFPGRRTTPGPRRARKQKDSSAGGRDGTDARAAERGQA